MARQVSPELEMLIPFLAQTMKYATQSIRQSSALGDVLIAKGIVTKEELDKAMRPTQMLTKKLLEVLEEMTREMD
jgi:fumarate hydratase class II